MPTLYSLDSTSLTVQKTITLEELMRLGEQVATTGRLSLFHVGDWLLQVTELYPHAYEEAAQRTRMDYGTLREAKRVAKAIPAVRRRESLGFSHHQEVAALEDDQQEKWLTIAEKEKASKQQLRAWIKHGKVITAKEAAKLAAEKLAGKGHKNIFEFLAYVDAHIGKLEEEKGSADTWDPDECVRMLEAFDKVMSFIERLGKPLEADATRTA